jgi:hypothetical protein
VSLSSVSGPHPVPRGFICEVYPGSIPEPEVKRPRGFKSCPLASWFPNLLYSFPATKLWIQDGEKGEGTSFHVGGLNLFLVRMGSKLGTQFHTFFPILNSQRAVAIASWDTEEVDLIRL